jgi:acyl-CoA synthetase (AMP-forming)/AMP-acid ligase II
MIKAGGIWVSQVEVEAALIRHPSVLECVVIAIEDEDGLQQPHAYVVLQPGCGGRDRHVRAAPIREGIARPVQVPEEHPAGRLVAEDGHRKTETLRGSQTGSIAAVAARWRWLGGLGGLRTSVLAKAA